VEELLSVVYVLITVPIFPSPLEVNQLSLESNIAYVKCLLCMEKVENAVQATKSLQDITNQSITPQTLHNNLKKQYWKAAVRQ